MSYDLLHERWLDVRTRAGRHRRIAPHDIVGDADDPIVDLVAPRADLRIAGIHFLIGLLQTTAEPETERAWRSWYQHPPPPDALREAFASAGQSFDLQHDEHPFLQQKGLDGEEAPALQLLFATPSGQTLRHNKDLFTKRRDEGALCAPCAALAVYALQSMAPGGGKGHRTSIRGGGPLTTHVEGPDLWRTLWLNVLPREAWHPDLPRGTGPRCFPWLDPGALGSKPVTLRDVDIGHHFWGMPRRIELRWEDAGPCHVCGSNDGPFATTLRTKPYGNDYGGSWAHPLTPTYEKDDLHLAVKGGRLAAGYRHWRGLVLDRAEDGRRPAPVMTHLWTTRAHGLRQDTGWRMSVHGMETDQATIVGWYEGEMPQIDIPSEEARAEHESHVANLLAAADQARTYLYHALKAAAGSGKPVKGDEAFWAATEQDFHQARLAASQRAGRESWRQALAVRTLDVFRSLVPYADIAQTDPGAVARAQRVLERNLRGQKLRTLLRLEEPLLET